MNPLISSLIVNGEKLAKLLGEAKSKDDQIGRQEKLNGIYKAVETVVNQVLENLETPQQLPSSFPETIIPKLYDKILLTLQNFVKLDSSNAPSYDQLAYSINTSKSKHLSSSSSPLPADHVPRQHSESPPVSGDDQDLFASLNEAEKRCLICFCLFTAGKEIKKREPIHLWVGMGLIRSPSQGEAMLAKLVDKGFVERTLRNKRFCNRYKMNGATQSRVIQALNISITPDGSLSILQLQQQQQRPPQPRPASMSSPAAVVDQNGTTSMLATIVLNVRETTLGAMTFERLSQGKKGDQVLLLLGSWVNNYERYIVLEDVDTLKALRNMRHVTCLSLQGISGIVELPESVYNLNSLKVLDLRACPNLESLSKGIDSLKELTHLDMSECYLLDHIPQGISALTKLIVLKGFVIIPDEDDPQQQVRDGGIAKIAASSKRASFSDLSKLEQLLKLTVRTRRLNFPTKEDFKTLSSMKVLTNLKLAWAASSHVNNSPASSPSSDDAWGDDIRQFPASLKKLELQAAPQSTILQLMRLISEDAHISLEKLYIRGSRQFDCCIEMCDVICHVHTVRLKYLPGLSIGWDDFREIFPNLTRLEVSGCPNLIFFPCDQYGVWVKKDDNAV